MSEEPRHGCQYIAGEKGRDFDGYTEAVYCRAPCLETVQGRSSYCPAHHAVCHMKRHPKTTNVPPAW